MTLAGLVSLPVARATFRERAVGLLPIAFTALAALGAFSNIAQKGQGGSTYEGFTRLFVMVLTMVLGAGLIADEVESGHAQLVMLRPVTRAEWFGGRFAGAGLVLLASLSISWLAGLLGFLRGGKPDLAWAASLPLMAVDALGWLAILAALSVILRRSQNIGLLIVIGLTYFFASVTLPLVMGKVGWLEKMRDAGRYLGPMDLADLIKGAPGARLDFAPLFYDLFWLFGAWLVGVLLFNQRELARRRS